MCVWGGGGAGGSDPASPTHPRKITKLSGFSAMLVLQENHPYHLKKQTRCWTPLAKLSGSVHVSSETQGETLTNTAAILRIMLEMTTNMQTNSI